MVRERPVVDSSQEYVPESGHRDREDISGSGKGEGGQKGLSLVAERGNDKGSLRTDLSD
jgi:hypothetical protein